MSSYNGSDIVILEAVATGKVAADDAAFRVHLIRKLPADDEHVVLEVRVIIDDAGIDDGDHRLRRSRAVAPHFGSLCRRRSPLARPQRVVWGFQRLAAHEIVGHRADDVGIFR